MMAIPDATLGGEPYSPLVRVFDLALAASALPAAIGETANHAPGPTSVGLYTCIARMARTALAGGAGAKDILSRRAEQFRPAADGLLAALDVVDQWWNTEQHRLYAENRDAYITEACGFEPGEIPRAEELNRLLVDATPYGTAATQCDGLTKILRGVFRKYSPARRLGMLIGDLWAFDTREAGGAPAPERLDAFRQIEALLLRWPDRERGYVLRVFSGPRLLGEGPDQFYCAIQEIRRGLAARFPLGAPDNPQPPTGKTRTKRGETPLWLGSALVLLKDCNGRSSDAQIARQVGINRSTLCRHPRWRQARRQFPIVRLSDVGAGLRASARAAKTTPEDLLRNERRNENGQ